MTQTFMLCMILVAIGSDYATSFRNHGILSQANSHSFRLSYNNLKMSTVKVESNPEKALLEPGEKQKYSIFSGILSDIKQRKPFYTSDWIDGLNKKSIAAICFLYFACLGIFL